MTEQQPAPAAEPRVQLTMTMAEAHTALAWWNEAQDEGVALEPWQASMQAALAAALFPATPEGDPA